MNKIVEALDKAGVKCVSHGPIKLRKCKDVENFLKRKKRQELIAIKSKMRFRADMDLNKFLKRCEKWRKRAKNPKGNVNLVSQVVI